MEKCYPAVVTTTSTSDSKCSSHVISPDVVTCSDNCESKWVDDLKDEFMFGSTLQNDSFVPQFLYQSEFATPYEDPQEQKPFLNWSFGHQGWSYKEHKGWSFLRVSSHRTRGDSVSDSDP